MRKCQRLSSLILASLLLCYSLLSQAADTAQVNPQVTIQTSLGNIVVELYPTKAPQTVANFLQYVDDGFYTNTLFHRVIDGFMIQGGGFTPEFQKTIVPGFSWLSPSSRKKLAISIMPSLSSPLPSPTD